VGTWVHAWGRALVCAFEWVSGCVRGGVCGCVLLSGYVGVRVWVVTWVRALGAWWVLRGCVRGFVHGCVRECVRLDACVGTFECVRSGACVRVRASVGHACCQNVTRASNTLIPLMFFVPCIAIQLCTVNQQNALFTSMF